MATSQELTEHGPIVAVGCHCTPGGKAFVRFEDGHEITFATLAEAESIARSSGWELDFDALVRSL